MNERELRTVMQEAVAVAPPPMSDEPVLTAARRALKRRRATAASAGSAAVVALVAAGLAVLAPAQDDDGGVRVGTAPPATAKTAPPPTSTGRTGATATSGPHYDRAVALAAALDDLAPAGYGTPGDLTGVGDFADRPLKTHSAMSLGDEGWYYAAGTPLTEGDGAGELIAAVYSPEWAARGDGCALTKTAWDAASADCTDVLVDGKKVAVADVTHPEQDGLPPAQWAGYRHPDGTVVFVMQAAEVPRSGRPALAGMPLPGPELAALAADPRLRAG